MECCSFFFFSQWTFFPELFKSTFAENIKCKKCKRAEQAAQHISVMSEAALTSQKFLGFFMGEMKTGVKFVSGLKIYQRSGSKR